jgi:RimJ/RimL family protein N-acetyltransferase
MNGRLAAVSSRVAQLHELQSFRAPGVVPGDVPLEPSDTLLGVLAHGGRADAVLLDRGAYLRIGEDWCLVPYSAIEARLPPKELPIAPLTLVTPQGNINILAGTSDVWDVGRFFQKCAEESTTQLIAQNREDVLAMIESMSPDEKAQLSADWMAQFQASSAMNPWVHGFRLVHRENGTVVGSCMFKGPPTDGIVEIAYGIDPDQQGKGYATEAAKAMVKYALHGGPHGPRMLPDSAASQRVLAKSGFRHVGEVVDPDDGLVWRFEKTMGD